MPEEYKPLLWIAYVFFAGFTIFGLISGWRLVTDKPPEAEPSCLGEADDEFYSHSFGMWEVQGIKRRRKCKRCGYVQTK